MHGKVYMEILYDYLWYVLFMRLFKKVFRLYLKYMSFIIDRILKILLVFIYLSSLQFLNNILRGLIWLLGERPGFTREIKSYPWLIFYVNFLFSKTIKGIWHLFDNLFRDIYRSSRIYCISLGYLNFPQKLPKIFKFCKD